MRLVSEAAKAYCQEKLMPRVQSAFREERFDREIMNEMGELGFLGSTIDGYVPRGKPRLLWLGSARSGRSTVVTALL